MAAFVITVRKSQGAAYKLQRLMLDHLIVGLA